MKVLNFLLNFPRRLREKILETKLIGTNDETFHWQPLSSFFLECSSASIALASNDFSLSNFHQLLTRQMLQLRD